MQYLAIGRGGHDFAPMPKGKVVLNLRWHEPSDSALFEHIPFIVRPLANDLSAGQRTNYRLRTKETFNGKDYWVYRLRVIPTAGVKVGLKETSIVNGVNNTTSFVPDVNDLSPTAGKIKTNTPTPTTGKYLTAEAIIQLTLSKADIHEIREACRVIYGDVAYAEISEFALVAGEDRTVSSIGTGGLPLSYTEIVSAQCTSMICSYYPLASVAGGIDISLNCGATAPLAL